MHVKKIKIEELNQKDFVFKEENEINHETVKDKLFLFDGFVLGMCSQGSMSLSINNHSYQIDCQDLFVILPRHVFTINASSADLNLHLLFISIDFIQKLPVIPNLNLFLKAEKKPFIALSNERLQEISALYAILKKYPSNNQTEQSIATSLMHAMLLIIISYFEESQIISSPQLTRQEELSHHFFKLLFQYFESEHRVTFYANKLCITPKYLSAAVKSVSGHPVQDWINEMILAEAKRYLQTSNLSILQIAEKMHFTSTSSFIRFFKKQMRMAPLEYRKATLLN